MYKKVLYNIKKMKKCAVGGGGSIFESKTLSMYLKKEKEEKKKLTEPGFEPTTSGLEIH